MNRSHESKPPSQGRAVIRSEQHWRAAAKKLFGGSDDVLGQAPTRHQPMATCPQCQLEFVLIFEESDSKPFGNYEVSCPRCARPFRFVHIKAKKRRKK